MNQDMIKDSLSEVLEQAWQLLGRGGADAKDTFHSPTLITQGENWPEARTVILREVDRQQRLLVCHSDVRASKWAEILTQPRVSWHLWHPRHRIQLRLYAQATLYHQDDVARAAWQDQSESSRLNYSAQIAPGTSVDQLSEAREAHTDYHQLESADTEAWYPHFGVIHTVVEAFDYLLLSREGHRRAHFRWHHDDWQGDWLVP